MTDIKKKKEEKSLIKLVLRRLPHQITEDELVKQLDPVPQNEALWFCEADTELMPFAFARLYIVFDSETEAIGFRDRWNGYVFVDSLGNETTAICELAPCQAVPKSTRMEDAQKRDKRVGTIESEVEYLKFLDEYANLTTKKVTNFDELIHEAEERERNHKQGLVKDTPLTDFLLKQAMERERKRAARSERHRTWDKNDKPSSSKLKEEPKENKNKKEKRPKEDRHNKVPPKKTDNIRAEAGLPKKSDNIRAEVKSKAISKAQSGVAASVPKVDKKKVESKKPDEPNSAKPTTSEKRNSLESKEAVPRDKPKGERENTGEKDPSSSGNGSRGARRNKDRPERAIYQPGRRSGPPKGAKGEPGVKDKAPEET